MGQHHHHGHDHHHLHLPQDAPTLMRLATYASVSVALLLIGIKFWAWGLSGSASILSSMMDSMLDLAISAMNLLAVRYALMPADENHHFGHNSAEDVAALGQGAFVGGSAIFIAITAINQLLNPQPLAATDVGIAVMVISLVLTFGLVSFQRYVVRRSNSTAIRADSLHYLSDLLMNGSIILALVLSAQLGWHWADPVLALIIAGVLLKGAWEIGTYAFDRLMDKSFPADEIAKIRALALETPGVLGISGLKTRYSGNKPFIQMDLAMDGNQTLLQAHAIAGMLEEKLKTLYPGGDIIIHEDPKV